MKKVIFVILCGVLFGATVAQTQSKVNDSSRVADGVEKSSFQKGAKKKPKSVTGVVVEEGALVYERGDFDSEVIATLRKGEKYRISTKVYNEAFFRIKLDDKTIGFIADHEIEPQGIKRSRPIVDSDQKLVSPPMLKKNKKSLNADQENGEAGANEESHAEEKAETKASEEPETVQKSNDKIERPFLWTRYWGPMFASINFREDTMGLQPTDKKEFFGLKLFGPNVGVEGPIHTEVNFLTSGVPAYYEQATGKSASGWILFLDLKFESVTAQAANVVSFFGMGPMFKYSKFDVSTSSPGVNSYSLEDMVLGMSFNAGIGLKIGSAALRGEVQYFWEKMQYLGLGLSLQFPF